MEPENPEAAVLPPITTSFTCACPRPLPRELGESKGIARTICQRCGLPVPLRW
jgi:hypothetical protein